MSPTLLELVVAVLLLCAAWQIAVRIGPGLLASFASYWSGPKPPADSDLPSSDKNAAPPDAVLPPPRKK